MFYVPQLPCYKIYKESAHALRIVWFENESNMGHFKQECVGDFLIQFLEMDLTEYEAVVWQFGSGTDFEPELLIKLGYTGLKTQLLNAADLLSGNLHLHRFLVGVMTQFFEDEKLTDIDQMKSAYLELVYIIQMHRQFSTGMAFCLDNSLYPDISIPRKFSGFIQSSKRLRNYKFQTGYGMAPVDKHGNLDYASVRQMNDSEMLLEEQLDIIHGDRDGVSLLPFTWILSFEDLIVYDFMELVSRGLRVKRCKLCNRYFVLRNKHHAEYCSRKKENGRTCKQVGPKLVFNAELEKPENAALREYERIRRMKQQQLERDRNKETEETMGQAQAKFDKWSIPAMALREKFIAGVIEDDEFLTGIKNITLC